MTNWRPIATAPAEFEEVLLYFPGQVRCWDVTDVLLSPRILVGMRAKLTDTVGWKQADSLADIEGEASHWMPLPAPPAQ